MLFRSVTSDASLVGVDVLGADLGFGKPVVAFQIDETGNGTHRSYQIYSLMKPPQLLHTITGASSYSAADTDLDGQVEIWADDAAAIDGFEGVSLESFDFAPAVVLRFERNRMMEVSSEFLPNYDAQIAGLRAQIDQQALTAFKSSDGVLSFKIQSAGDQLHRLARTKIKVLEIVWAYLYSGRDAEAWSVLQEMWPPQDFNRIRMAISDIHQRGILRGVDHALTRPKHRSQVHIYDGSDSTGAVRRGVLSPYSGAPDTEEDPTSVVQPKPILLRRPPAGEVERSRSTESVMELVVDAAGKVRSAKMLDGTDDRWIKASAGWHFIPAIRNGSPVACRFRLSVWDLK